MRLAHPGPIPLFPRTLLVSAVAIVCDRHHPGQCVPIAALVRDLGTLGWNVGIFVTTIETANTGSSTTIRVHGDLNAEQVGQFERCWHRNCKPATSFHLDLRDVRQIDAAGKSLITRMFAEGVELVVRSHRR